MYFLLGTEGFHESTSFDTFKCADGNLPNCSCHFPNHESVFLQILHNSSVSWKITRLTLCTLHERDQNANFGDFWVLGSKLTKFLSFLKQQIGFSSNFTSFFSIMRNNSSVLFSLKFYILSSKGAYQSTNLVKFHLSSWKSKILHFDGLLL